MHVSLCVLIQTHYYYFYYLHKTKHTCTHTQTYYTYAQNNTACFSNANTGFFPNYFHSLYSTLVCTIFSGLFCVWFKCGDTKFIADSIWSNWLTIDCKLSIHMLFIYIVCRSLVVSGTSIFCFNLMPFTNSAIFTNISRFLLCTLY